MKKLKMTTAIIVAVIIIAGVALRLAVPTLSSTSAATGISLASDGSSTLGDCPDTPNCEGSESSKGASSVSRFMLTKSADTAIDTLASIVLSQPGSHVVVKDKRYLHATFSTRIMGFTDDVEFLVNDDQRSVQVRSASRLGRSDLGANARRVTSLRSIAENKI